MEAVKMRQMHIGLGEAMERLMKLEQRLTNGFPSSHDMEERKLLLDALNSHMLDLGFDCGDTKEAEIPSTVAIFAKSAATSCCRILPADNSRRSAAPPSTISPADPTTPILLPATVAAPAPKAVKAAPKRRG